MKSLPLALLIFSCSLVHAQTVLFSEDFSGEADGDVAGTAVGGTWNVTTSPPGTFSRQIRIGQPIFEADNTGTEGVFETSSIDISGTGMATISVQFRTSFSSATDYLRAYYKVDGGPEILFAEFLGQLIDITVNASAIVAGNDVVVVIRGNENTPGNIPIIGIPIIMGFDNLAVTSVPVLYSCTPAAAHNWNVAGTWSTIGFTGPCDAPAPPTVGQVAIIGGGVVVDLTADANVGGVDVRNTGTLRYAADFLDVGIEMGFFRVQSGGTVDENSKVAAQVDFTQNVGGATFQVDLGGSVNVDAIVLTNNASNLHYLAGDGVLTVGQIQIDVDNATLTNNMTNPVILSGHLEFMPGTNGSTFVNNGTLIAPALEFGDDNNFFTNNSFATFPAYLLASNANADDNTVTNSVGATLNIGTVDADYSGASTNGGNLTILNAGTINQTGTFLNIANNGTALNDINNLAGATWNYAGTGHDTNLRLFAHNGTNDFNYTAAGAQQIITPVAGNGYSNLSLGNSGIKTALANFSVYGNWARTGTALFAPAGFTVTFSGSTAQTISAVTQEIFSGLTLSNTFATAPQITLNTPVTVTGTLTMTSGRVNQASNTFTLGSTGGASTLVRTASTTTNWMYGGSFKRFWLNGVAVSSTAGNRYGLFPVGTSSASSYRPVEINSTVSPTADGDYTVTHTNASGATDLSPVYDDDPTAGVLNIMRKHNAQFNNVVTGATGGTYTIGVTMTGLLGVGNLTDIRLAVSNGSTTVTNVGAYVASTGTVSNPTAIRSGLTTANLTGDFRITTTDAVATPLPVELVSFKGEVVENFIQLSWKTASEVNNDFFIVERSAGGESFSAVGKVIGAGTTSEGHQYSLMDYQPMYGTAYYRLKQTDFDGTSTYSKTISITYEGSLTPALDVYPNPSAGEDVIVKISGLKDIESIPVVMYDELGRQLMSLELKVDTRSGTASETLAVKDLPQGMYMLKSVSTHLLMKRLVVNPR